VLAQAQGCQAATGHFDELRGGLCASDEDSNAPNFAAKAARW